MEIKFLSQIKEAILFDYPNESCGFLTTEGYFRVENFSKNPLNSFEILPEAFIYYNENFKIKAIVHSHTLKPKQIVTTDLRTPSYSDIINQKRTGIPWLIFGTEGINITEAVELPRKHNPVYLKRPFIWFINDCWTLVQDYYWFERGIVLRDAVPDREFKKLMVLDKLFDGKYEDYGFKETIYNGKLTQGDVVVVDNKGFKKNHLCIYHNGQFLHQNNFSELVPVETFIGHIHSKLQYIGNGETHVA